MDKSRFIVALIPSLVLYFMLFGTFSSLLFGYKTNNYYWFKKPKFVRELIFQIFSFPSMIIIVILCTFLIWIFKVVNLAKKILKLDKLTEFLNKEL